MPKQAPKPGLFSRKWVRSALGAIVIFAAGVAMGGTWSPDQHGCTPSSISSEVSRG